MASLSKKEYIIYILMGLILCALVLSPMLKSGYVSDDSLNSMKNGVLMINRGHVLHYLYSYMSNMMIHAGRFLPLGGVSNALVFMLIPNLVLYKLFVLFLILLNIILYAFLIQLISGSKIISLLSIWLLPLCFQFRLYHDPILSLGGLLQLTFLYILISLILLYFFLMKEKTYLLILSLIFYAVSLMTSEIAYPFFIFHAMIIYLFYNRKSASKIIKKCLPFVFLSFVFIAATVLVKLSYPQANYPGTKVRLDVVAFLATLLRQSFASLPLSYFGVDPKGIFADTLNLFRGDFSITDIIIPLGFAAVFLKLSDVKRTDITIANIRRNIGFGYLFGISLVLSPGLLISFVPRYQKQITWGIGYIPVYISYFGISLCLALSVYLVYQADILKTGKKSTIILAVIFILCSIGGIVNYHNNKNVVRHFNYSFLFPRQIVENAMRSGMFNVIPPKSSLIVDADYDLNMIQGGWNFYRWDKPAFYTMHSGIRFKNILTREDYLRGRGLNSTEKRGLKDFDVIVPSGDIMLYLKYRSHSYNQGYAILGRTRNYICDKHRIHRTLSADATYIYVESAEEYIKKSNIAIIANVITGNLRETVAMDEAELALIRSGINWKLFKLVSKKHFDLSSMAVVL